MVTIIKQILLNIIILLKLLL